MSPVKKTDYQLAQEHKYVTVHGRKPAPGVTSCDIVEIPALKYSSAEIGVLAALEVDKHDERLAEAFAYLEEHPRARIKTFGGDKVSWRNASDDEIYVYWLRGKFQRDWTAKADEGTVTHDITETLSRGQDVDVPRHLAGLVTAWLRFHDDCKPEWIALERILVHPCPLGRDDLEVGGRSDFFAVLHDGPYPGVKLGDYKTGGQYVGPVCRQAAGYLAMAGMATYLDNGDLGPLDPMPPTDGAVTVYLNRDGTYAIKDAFEHECQEDATRAFFDLRSALNHHRRIEVIERKLAKERDSA